MLSTKIKTSIDKARDILVGKIPNPSAQVEQITIAMLYKFMDDMDQDSILLGGKPTFFAGDFKKYSWKNIMSKTMSAQERYNKYTEALEKFYTHPGLPQTFKDVFKNAIVPFKEADILTMFLKEIDSGLSYEDSEQLGDAYEYLLSVLGSQGELGQFRTPRHIIDMIVEIVDPKKTDAILDPACGTAGFLISAYKHILKENTDKVPGDKMNYDERMEVLKHITGYDIEPSMVRIAEMNMFLHGATDPNIYEYDTLTDDTKWEDTFTVIFGNPPFMTPKGGIKPHSKFSVSSNRAEVLFADYIETHLRRAGRAGVIVPEGVVFQTSKGYLQLRKSLVENSLIAVISLPSGIFNPYAGVKTSVLIFDKKIAKKREHVLFVELKNDGFSLGAQRNPIKGSEIPEIIKAVKDFQKGKEVKFKNSSLVLKKDIEKEKYNLSVNKYKKVEITEHDFGDPEELMKELKNNNKEYIKLLTELEGL